MRAIILGLVGLLLFLFALDIWAVRAALSPAQNYQSPIVAPPVSTHPGAAHLVQVGSGQTSAPACPTVENLQAAVTAQVPAAAFMQLRDQQARSFMAAFNAMPPQSHVFAETVVLVSLPEAPMVSLGFFNAGCMVGRGLLPVKDAGRLVAIATDKGI